jgi:tetratricopeptide (TPR) repeat protein
MEQKTSRFVISSKPWIMRKTLAEFFRAKNLFKNLDREVRRNREIPFSGLKNLTDLLFSIKEDLHLVFKRVIEPQKRQFERSGKYTPTTEEIEFINIIGLLFHKSMVARELKYVMEHYATDSEDYSESKESLQTYWFKLNNLFSDGTECIKKLLQDYVEYDVILWYILENSRYVEDALDDSIDQLLMRNTKLEVDEAYVNAANYCFLSGWPEKAKRLYGEALKYNPENHEATNVLRKLS